jgi:hypothetical protein
VRRPLAEVKLTIVDPRDSGPTIAIEAALTLSVAALAPVGYSDMLAKPPFTNGDAFQIRSRTITSGRRLSRPAGP